jgi:PAS domain-containing protein
MTGIRDEHVGRPAALAWTPGSGEELRAAARLLAQDADRATVVQDRDGVVMAANVQAAELLGTTVEDLAGNRWLDPRWHAVSEWGLPLTPEQHPAGRALTTGASVPDTLVGLTMVPARRTVWLETTAHPLTDGPGGPLLGVLVLMKDVTEGDRARCAMDSLVATLRATRPDR